MVWLLLLNGTLKNRQALLGGIYRSTVALPLITPNDSPTLAVPLESDFKVRKPAALKSPFTVTVPNLLPAVIFKALPSMPLAPGVTHE